jgi:hypothetical protein
MGSPLSPFLSEIFLSDFEKSFLLNPKSPFIKNIKFWCRYVDDVLCLWTGTERQLNNFFNFINSLNSKIQFTMEIEQDKKINYLDLSISHKNSKFSFGIFRKETYTDSIIPYNSAHHYSTKLAALNSMAYRLANVPMDPEEYSAERNTILTIANNNGFPTSLVTKIINRFN